MRVSDLIKELESIKKDYGDLPVNRDGIITLKAEDDNLLLAT